MALPVGVKPVDRQGVSVYIAWDGDSPVWCVEILTHPTDPTEIIGSGATIDEAAQDATEKLLAHAAERPFYAES